MNNWKPRNFTNYFHTLECALHQRKVIMNKIWIDKLTHDRMEELRGWDKCILTIHEPIGEPL